jgi:hypothetical protein
VNDFLISPDAATPRGAPITKLVIKIIDGDISKVVIDLIESSA